MSHAPWHAPQPDVMVFVLHVRRGSLLPAPTHPCCRPSAWAMVMAFAGCRSTSSDVWRRAFAQQRDRPYVSRLCVPPLGAPGVVNISPTLRCSSVICTLWWLWRWPVEPNSGRSSTHVACVDVCMCAVCGDGDGSESTRISPGGWGVWGGGWCGGGQPGSIQQWRSVSAVAERQSQERRRQLDRRAPAFCAR